MNYQNPVIPGFYPDPSVCRAVGYEDDHVFIRRFKKYTGMTPGQYRKDAVQE